MRAKKDVNDVRPHTAATAKESVAELRAIERALHVLKAILETSERAKELRKLLVSWALDLGLVLAMHYGH